MECNLPCTLDNAVNAVAFFEGIELRVFLDDLMERGHEAANKQWMAMRAHYRPESDRLMRAMEEDPSTS